MSGARKGSAFERTICRKLSEWWTDGKTDDVFWRSSQSGGRATIRGRKGKRTAGSYGDIVALDPIGEPLLKMFTIELKCGRSHGEPGDLLNCKGKYCHHPFIKTLQQADSAHKLAGSRTWLIICRTDRRHETIFFPAWLLKKGEALAGVKALRRAPVFRYKIKGFHFVGVRLDKFLKFATPDLFA